MSWVFPVIGNNEWSGGSWMPNRQNHRGRTHAAVDIYASRGQSIVSPVNGTIRSLGSGSIGGNWVRIDGDDGLVYYFAHMDAPTTWKKGQKVQGGAVIGQVGNSGSASTTSPHLHFSVKKDGIAISPIDMLRGGVIVPDLERAVTGVGAGLDTGVVTDPIRRQPIDFGDTATSGVTREPVDEPVPKWFEQLALYREQLATAQAEPPEKIKARDIMRGSLEGMARMVRNSGFNTGSMPDTGIDEGQTIEREDPRNQEAR